MSSSPSPERSTNVRRDFKKRKADPEGWLAAVREEAKKKAVRVAELATGSSHLAVVLASHDADEPVPLTAACGALKDSDVRRLLCERTELARRVAAALLAPLATPELHALIEAGGDAPDDETVPEVEQQAYLNALHSALYHLEDGWMSGLERHNRANVLSEEAVRNHLPVLGHMLRQGDSWLFTVATYALKAMGIRARAVPLGNRGAARGCAARDRRRGCGAGGGPSSPRAKQGVSGEDAGSASGHRALVSAQASG